MPDDCVQCVRIRRPRQTLTITLASALGLAVWLSALTGCRTDTTVIGVASDSTQSDTTPKDTTGNGGGTVSRATLTISVPVNPLDQAIASRIGWSAGVPGATVTISRVGSSAVPVSATTDPAGAVRFLDLLPGTYNLSVVRVLSPEEAALLDGANADVNAFGGGAQAAVAAPSKAVTLTASAGRRGSLVISELYGAIPRLPSGGYYLTATYIELYNNSDTTIYLDGKVIGRGQAWVRAFPPPKSCVEWARWRTDPDGIWSRYLYQFPGSGQTYPLLPGRTVVVATDAIDHSEFLSGLPNLSRASFEFIGSSDVDNPTSANMLNIGLGDWNAGFGHGLYFDAIDLAVFVADSLDPASLVRDQLPVVSPDFQRVPTSKLLDVLTTNLVAAVEATITPLCPEIVNTSIDRQYASLLDGENVNSSIQRRVLGSLPDGRTLLLRTRTSARDFESRLPSPRQVP